MHSDDEPVSTSDGSLTLHSTRYQETYHSSHGAVVESKHVFLEASGMRERLAQQLPCSVLEVGFGLALNYLLTADEAITNQSHLKYTAWEHDPIDVAQFRALEYQSGLGHPQLIENVADILDCASNDLSRPSSEHSCVTRSKLATIELTLHCADITESKLPEQAFDAVYLDAFSPEVNPECWTPKFFEQLKRSMKPGAKLSTYCAKGRVRRDLQALGFDISRLPGPPGKREILVARA